MFFYTIILPDFKEKTSLITDEEEIIYWSLLLVSSCHETIHYMERRAIRIWEFETVWLSYNFYDVVN